MGYFAFRRHIAADVRPANQLAAAGLGFVFTVFSMFSMAGCVYSRESSGRESPVPAEPSPAEIWIASDIHLLSPELTDMGPLFARVTESGDGKMVGDSEEITDALLQKVMEEKPDALILSGDLTFNGELASLELLAGKLETVQNAGIPVLVIPGNHDIEYPYAYEYKGEKAEAVERISEADFKRICGPFGYDSAVAGDSASFSYLYLVREDLGILCLDANTVKNPGRIGAGTLKWLEEQLIWARERGIKLISVTHQNMLPQSSLLSEGFVLDNCEEVVELLEKYGVNSHFSGHSHIQHSRTEGSLTDVAVGSLTVAPLRYGVIREEGPGEGAVTYEPASLDILQDKAAEYFDQTTRRQVLKGVARLSLAPEEKNHMTEFAVKVNRQYFAGILTDDDRQKQKQSREWKLWEEKGRETFWYYYLDSILSE